MFTSLFHWNTSPTTISLRRMSVDLPEHVYDRLFVKRRRVNGNAYFNALITELKNKRLNFNVKFLNSELIDSKI